MMLVKPEVSRGGSEAVDTRPSSFELTNGSAILKTMKVAFFQFLAVNLAYVTCSVCRVVGVRNRSEVEIINVLEVPRVTSEQG